MTMKLEPDQLPDEQDKTKHELARIPVERDHAPR